MSTVAAPNDRQDQLNQYGRRRFIQVFGIVAVYAIVLFAAAGTLRWPAAWAYLGLYLVSILTGGLYVARKHPAIINERGRPSGNTKRFDKIFGILYIPAGLGVLAVAGLDYRFGWSTVPDWLQIASFVLLVPLLYVSYWVMLANAHAATTVRVELDRGHTVVSSGPYRIVRHPMYASVVVGNFFLPLALGSLWAYIPAMIVNVLFIWRTAQEDRVLLGELPGYAAYAETVPYRLFPGVW